MTAARIARHERLSALLASRSDFELAELVDTGRVTTVGVGGCSALIDVDGMPVFTKRIPLTDRELAHSGSTANLFDLPMFCQYGIGGPSLNAWRELAANIIVTDAVLAGETQSFPVLYHWRVLPGRSTAAAEHADIDAVVTAQGGCPTVRARLEALAVASCSLMLFCEYIPRPIADWLRENPPDTQLRPEPRVGCAGPGARGRRIGETIGAGAVVNVLGEVGSAHRGISRGRRRPLPRWVRCSVPVRPCGNG